MKTRQEQIEAMAGIIAETLQDKRVENGATFVSYLPSLLGSADKEKEVAEELIKAGYGDVAEYKAEIRELKADLDHQIDATNDAENLASHLQDDYDKAFERLKAQEREIKKLREENLDLKEELYELHDDLDIARTEKDKTIQQAQIDVLNKAKEKLDSAPNGWAYTGYIDDLIEEVQSK